MKYITVKLTEDQARMLNAALYSLKEHEINDQQEQFLNRIIRKVSAALAQ